MFSFTFISTSQSHVQAWLRFGKPYFFVIIMMVWDILVFTGRLLGNVKVFTAEFAYIAMQPNSG